MDMVSTENKSSLWTKILAIRDKVESFCVKDAFPFIVALVAFVFHVLAWDLTGIVTLALSASIAFVVFKDGRPAITIAIMTVFVVSKEYGPGFKYNDNIYGEPRVYVTLLVVIGIVLITTAIKAVRNVGSLKRSKLLIPLGVLSLSILLSGVGQKYYVEGLPFASLIAFSFVGFYVILSTSLKDTQDVIAYAEVLLSAVALLVSLSVAHLYIDHIHDGGKFRYNWKDMIYLGWGVSNNAGAILLLSLPFTMRKVEKGEKFSILYQIIAIVSLVAIVATMTKTAMLIGFPLFVVLWIRAMIKTPRKAENLITILVLLGLIIIAFIVVAKRVNITEILNYFKKSIKAITTSMFDSSRADIIEQAIGFFKGSPIVGAGFAMSYHYPLVTTHSFLFHTLTHNFVFQAVGSGGIVGVCALGFFLYSAVRLLAHKYNGKFHVLCFIIAFALNSLLDITYFLPYCIAFFLLAVVAVEKLVKNKESENEKN